MEGSLLGDHHFAWRASLLVRDLNGEHDVTFCGFNRDILELNLFAVFVVDICGSQQKLARAIGVSL